MAYEKITLTITEQIATITLNKPERLNAACLDMTAEIIAALDNLTDARALLITGMARAFCSGADLPS